MVAKWILQFHSDLLFAVAAKYMKLLLYLFTSLASHTDVLVFIGTTSNKTEAVSWRRKQNRMVTVAKTVIRHYNLLFDYQTEAKLTVEF